MAFLEKGLLLYLCFCIGCSFWNPTLVFGNQNMLTNMFNINSTNISTTQGVDFGNQNFNNPSQEFKVGYEGTNQQTQWVVDPLGNTISFIGNIFQFLFSPFTIFMNLIGLGAPISILFVFAIPIVFLVWLGILIFVRSGFA